MGFAKPDKNRFLLFHYHDVNHTIQHYSEILFTCNLCHTVCFHNFVSAWIKLTARATGKLLN